MNQQQIKELLENEEMEVNESLYLKQLIEMEEPQVQKAAMTFLDRLIQEQTELEDKITKLESFVINKEKAISISGELQFNYLTIQLNLMMGYNNVLRLRIKDLTK